VKQVRKRITYANIMSSIAVFLVLGGGAAYAAQKIGSNEIKGNSITTGKIKKEAVTASKIKDGSVTTSKIAKDAVTGDKVNESTLGQVPSAATAANANALGGKPATAYAASSVLRTVSVEANGTVVAAKSDGIAQANVSRVGTGFYCIKGLSPKPVTSVASIGFGADVGSTIYPEIETSGECEINIVTYNASNAGADEPFALFVH
jgi:hypothetical protein